MTTALLNDFVCIPLSLDLYQSLSERYSGQISTVLENIIWDFLERTEDDFVSISSSGFPWGALFLPDGTQLRVKKSRSNDYSYAEIIDEKIIYQGSPVNSPSRFARKVRNNTSVNAWINVEIKRPQDRGWRIANSFRR